MTWPSKIKFPEDKRINCNKVQRAQMPRYSRRENIHVDEYMPSNTFRAQILNQIQKERFLPRASLQTELL